MQAHGQLQSQVSGAQLSGAPQQPTGTLPSQGNGRRIPWQSDADVSVRQMISEKILQVFQRRRNFSSPSMQQEVSDLVDLLEDSLYRNACSKEEYCDLSTLEQRLNLVFKRFCMMRANASVLSRGMNVAVSPMIPTPGMPAMIPTQGHEVAASDSSSKPPFSNMEQMMVISMGNVGNIIPTSGLMPSSSENSMYKSMDLEMLGRPSLCPQESVTTGLVGHVKGGSMSINRNETQRLELQNLNNCQHNPTTMSRAYPNSSFYTNSSNLSAYSHHQQQHLPLQGISSCGPDIHCYGPPKMIPVPGMPLQQGNNFPVQMQTKKAGDQILYAANPSVAEVAKPSLSLSAEGNQKAHWTSVQAQAHQHQQQGVSLQCSPNSLMEVSVPQSVKHASSVDATDEVDSCKSEEGSACHMRTSNLSVVVSLEQQRAQHCLKQQRWILILWHARSCRAPEGQCQISTHCNMAKQLLAHLTRCRIQGCQFPHCAFTRDLLRHHRQCKQSSCPVCVPVRIQMQSSVCTSSGEVTAPGSFLGLQHDQLQVIGSRTCSATPLDAQQPSAKRLKVESSEKNVIDIETFGLDVTGSDTQGCSVGLFGESDVQVELPIKCAEHEVHVKEGHPRAFHCGETSRKLFDQGKHDQKELANNNLSSSCLDPLSNAKAVKSKNKGVSLIELFTPEQIRQHIAGLRTWVGQNKAKADKNQAFEHQMNENSCHLCAAETLSFEPPPIYCTLCGARIKRNAFYCTLQCGETRHNFCMPCFNDTRGDSVVVDGQPYLKARLEKRRNDEETEEPWVQCDKCEKWQHQICSLFNMRRNEGGQAEYTCPNCLLIEMEKGERIPLPQSALLGAKDLPKTFLSDHIEQRLARRLKEERHERALAQGKTYNEVPGADPLVVRIVSSVDKRMEVKPQFLEMFQQEEYPAECSYKSKVLLLFQKIEGVEVFLFGMYIQEFGEEAAKPNQRHVYLSYLDSVKYFRPEITTINGDALRTFVYHEILIGYLDYCKKRGFTSCYIWACPPLKGEDYILYCHPEIQKTPKSDKLRDWYLAMLSKASSEGIVVEVTNLYDQFFVCTGEAKSKVTAARLPYFDGDYWPGAAEEMILLLQKNEIGPKQIKKGKAKGATKRATKGAAMSELATSNASKDLQLMHKLGESIYPMREDFILVHMQILCSHCRSFILSGFRWTCKLCKNFNLCERCYAEEQKLDEGARHPMNSKEAHELTPRHVEILPDTKDKDEVMESEFFDTRQAFLSLCQGNHYQFDTLRRAKSSSMMALYHLHNPTAPAYVTTCNICHCDIETGQGWRCEVCPDFDICNPCYTKDYSCKHPHKLVPHPSAADLGAQNKEARQQRVLQLRKMLELLVHSSKCGHATQCQYPNCLRVKGLFRHGLTCKTRASGGCQLCKKMWYLLQLHARACKEAECRVPRCKDLKGHLRRLQQQQELRRRKAVMEMMKQRAHDG